MMYKDTFGYFKSSELLRFLSGSDTERFKKVLEIGSYEGIFSCYAAENFATIVHTIDPFDTSDEGTTVTNDVESNFNHNVSVCSAGEKIISHKKLSDEFFETNKEIFDFIYVDGSHESDAACRDLDNSLSFCRKSGIIWVDDYGSDYKDLHESIDKWLNDHEDDISVFHKGYQVGFIKL